MVSFRGNLLSYMSNATQSASFVELCPYDRNDQKSLNRVVKLFIKGGVDTSLLSDTFQLEGTSTNGVNSRYFVLTKQDDKFEIIRPEQVLGVAKTTTDNDSVLIDTIHVNPLNVYHNPLFTSMNGIKSIIDCLKNTFNNKLVVPSLEQLEGYCENKVQFCKKPFNKGSIKVI